MSAIDDLLKLLGLLNTTGAAALPAPLPVAWMGVDRSGFPQVSGSGDVTWFGLLMDNSNLRLSGAYLEGTTFPTGGTSGQFTGSTKSVARDWIPHIGPLRDIGWGIAFWYVGYSVGGGEPLPSLASLAKADYAARGTLHAQHAKTIVAAISPSMEGAVVYFDNEDSSSTDVATLLPYYEAFFDEIQRPGPGTLPALRPGLYAHNPIAAKFLADRPYVFVWEVTLDTSTTTTPTAPFTASDNPLAVGATRQLNPFQVKRGTQSAVGWPVGRQFRYYTGAMPVAGSALNTGVSGFTAYKTWDYDSSVVRDPAYPSGNPRLAVGVAPPASAGTADLIVVQGGFTPRGADPPKMTVDVLAPSGHVNVTPVPARTIEPDSPIAGATFPGAQQSTFASIMNGGDVAVFDSSARTWASTQSSGTVQPRRLRALSSVLFGAADQQVFFIGQDRAIYGLRNSGGGWGTPLAMGGALRVHPSAILAAASRPATSVDVFTFNDAGLLTTTWWAPPSTHWPDTNSQVLETAPSAFLPMGALAAVSAAANKLHVFGIGADLRLRYLEFTNTTWGGVQALGAATDLVFPHSRIAACLVSATRITVAVFSDAGRVRVHVLDGAGGAWTEILPPVLLDAPVAAAPAGYTPPAAGVPVETAYGWSLNPYGDLAIASSVTGTTVFAAGLKPGDTAVLRWSIGAGLSPIWERFR